MPKSQAKLPSKSFTTAPDWVVPMAQMPRSIKWIWLRKQALIIDIGQITALVTQQDLQRCPQHPVQQHGASLLILALSTLIGRNATHHASQKWPQKIKGARS